MTAEEARQISENIARCTAIDMVSFTLLAITRAVNAGYSSLTLPDFYDTTVFQCDNTAPQRYEIDKAVLILESLGYKVARYPEDEYGHNPIRSVHW